MTLNDMSFYEGAMINSSHVRRKDTKRLNVVSNTNKISFSRRSDKPGSFKRIKRILFEKHLINNFLTFDKRPLISRSIYRFSYHFLR